MPLMDIFWTTLMIFFWVLWFTLLFRVYADLFGRSDIGGWAKTGWVVLTLLLPYVGVLAYLVTQGRTMVERSAREVERRRAATDAHIQSVVAEREAQQSAKAQDLLRSGAITPEEYERLTPAAHR